MAFSKGAPIFARIGKTSTLFGRVNTQNRIHFSGITKHLLSTPNCLYSLDNVLSRHPQALYSLTSNNLTLPQTQMTREFHKTSLLQQNDNPKPRFGEQMSLRLMNENGFLSWTRNSYLSAAVGATMLNGANADLAPHAGIFVLMVSAMNMVWGSACHMSNLIRIRDRCAMSRPTLFLNLLGCFFHAVLWLFTLGCYLHFSGHAESIKQRRRQRQGVAHPLPSKEQ